MALPPARHKSRKIGWQAEGMKHAMPTARPDAPLSCASLEAPLGVFVDGENLPSWAAERILTLVGRHPAPRVCRVYGDYERLEGWRSEPSVEVVHTGVPGTRGDNVKNTADIKIAVDVMEFALREGGRTVVLCSSDRDFTPLVWALRRLGVHVVGVGEAKAAEGFTAACPVFHTIRRSSAAAAGPVSAGTPPPESVVAKVRKVLEPHVGTTEGMPLNDFGMAMGQRQKVRVKDLGYPTWRAFAERNPGICTLIGQGQSTRIKPA